MLCVLRLHRLSPVVRNLRFLSSAPESQFAVDKVLLSKLRKKTGYPVINCRNALEKFNNDVKEAEQWMREQAQKEGWAKASKLQGRPMSQGLVGLIQEDDVVTMVEVNCETDFVARNETFQDLVTKVTETCHKNFSERNAPRVDVGKEELNSLEEEEGKTLGDQVALTVGNLGENIALRRAAAFRNDPDTVMSCYTHAAEGLLNSLAKEEGKPLGDQVALTVGNLGENIALRRAAAFRNHPDTVMSCYTQAAGPAIVRGRCKLGKFAAIVKVRTPDVETVATQLCQHIIGMKPTEIGDWDQPPPVAEKGEKKKKKGKSDEESKKKEEKEEAVLLKQEFLLEPKFNVRGYLQNSAPRVVDFVRLECGEDLGEDN